MRKRTHFQSLTNTDATIYTVPLNTSTKWMMVLGTTNPLNLSVVRSATTYPVSTAASNSLMGDTFCIYLEAGDEIRGSTATGTADIALSLEETTGIVSTN